MSDLSQYIQEGRKYYIYGIKDIADYYFSRITEQLGLDAVIGFIQTQPSVAEHCNKKVFALSEIETLNDDTYIILAAAKSYHIMQNNLIEKGIENDKIIIVDKIYPYFKNIAAFRKKRIEKVCFWPPIKDSDKDIQKKIAWFLPDKAEIIVWSESEIPEKFYKNVHIEKQENIVSKFDEADIICLWDTERDTEVLEDYLDKVYAVDPNFYLYTETRNYSLLYYKALSGQEQENFFKQSKELFCKIKNDNKMKRANIFCTGPSIEEIYSMELEPGVNIITNSMVKDKEFLDRIKPKLLIFSDMNFYVSPTEYCKRFYEDVIEAVERYDMNLIVYDCRMPLILHHFPKLQGKIIGIPFNYGTKEFNFPDMENFYVKGTRNILTELALPIASSLCEEIGIAGCTGRNPDETYYWKHNPNTQYLDLMQSVFDMYPSVFRDQGYGNYYEEHCETVRDIIGYGESRGKKYVNLTTSFIPALKEQTMKGNENNG